MKIIIFYIALLLSACGEDTLVHLDGEHNEAVIIAIVSPDQIFIQGYEGAMTFNELQAKISAMLGTGSGYSFVIQPSVGPDHKITKDVLGFLKESGVKSRHIAVAKGGA